MGTYTPADWVHLLATRFSLKAEQPRQLRMPCPSLLCCLTWQLLAVSSGNSRWTSGAHDNPVCFLLSSLSHAPVCTLKASPCVPAPRPQAEKHVRVMPAYTGTFLTYTRRRSERTHGVFQRASPHRAHTTTTTTATATTTHTTDHTTDTPTHNTTPQHAQHHTETETEKERQRREDERGERRQDKTRQDGREETIKKSRQDEREEDIEEERKKR